MSTTKSTGKRLKAAHRTGPTDASLKEWVRHRAKNDHTDPLSGPARNWLARKAARR